MKRGCTILLIFLSLLYLNEAKKVISEYATVTIVNEAFLSDIAKEVIAIPLEVNVDCQLTHVSQIKRDKNELFLINNGELHHFDYTGKYIGCITNNQQFIVTDYTLNTDERQLIVMDKNNHVYFYDYEGNLLRSKSLAKFNPIQSETRLLYHNKHIYFTAQSPSPSTKKGGKQDINQWLYRFDSFFNLEESRKLAPVDLGRFHLEGWFSPQLSVANGNVYAHTHSTQPDELLTDTLYLIKHNLLEINHEYASVLPLCIASRYLISTYSEINDKEQNSIFCYDRHYKLAYQLKNGFEDNFYNTGNVFDLQAMDNENSTFCFLRNSGTIKDTIPNFITTNKPVLFIVKLNA